MKLYFLIASAVLVTGCATTQTGPIKVGEDMYLISRQAGAFPSGREPLLQESVQAANQRCSSDGKKMSLISSTENPGPYILFNYPKATITFKCE